MARANTDRAVTADTPAARASMLSSRLMALVTPTIQTIVIRMSSASMPVAWMRTPTTTASTAASVSARNRNRGSTVRSSSSSPMAPRAAAPTISTPTRGAARASNSSATRTLVMMAIPPR